MATVLLSGDFVTCPYCEKLQSDDPVEDYVIPGQMNRPCKEPCCWCDEEFNVTQIARDTFKVTKLEE